MTDETRQLQCRCGAMVWRIAPRARGSRVVCYCADCQTAARHLGAEDRLDDAGGTEIFQTLPADVEITRGARQLALMRLGPKGLFRWHAGCCGTPVANTLATPGFSFAGMVLPAGRTDFGPVTARVQTQTARRPVRGYGFAATGFQVVGRALRARLTKAWRRTPFFDATGAPVAVPRVLSLAEREAARPDA